MTQEQDKQKILAYALNHVAFDGWTKEVFDLAVKESGVAESVAILAFPDNIKSLVSYFAEDTDARMMAALNTKDLPSLRIRNRIKTAVETRIMLFKNTPSIVAKTLTYYAQPQHAAQATENLFKTVDLMWQAAGDNTTDFNYYSKRFLLAGVYSSTLLYWLDDHSDNYQDTWNFLDRRIENVMQIGKVKQQLKDIPFIRMFCKR